MNYFKVSKTIAILLSMSFGAFLKEWKCINKRIVLVRLKVKGVWVSLIQVYAPAEDRSQDVKDEFYAKLQDTVGEELLRDLLIVMGDLNARVGNETDIWGEVLGVTLGVTLGVSTDWCDDHTIFLTV